MSRVVRLGDTALGQTEARFEVAGSQDDENELLAEVERALRARGVSGRPELRGSSLVFRNREPLDVSGTLAQWKSLPEDLRQKRCAELAALLSDSRAGVAVAARRASRFGMPSLLAPLAILGIGVASIWYVYRWLAPTGGRASGAVPSASASVSAVERDRMARSSGACAAARTRAVEGASLGPTDVEGWVVELLLLRPDSEPLSHVIDGFLAPATSERGARLIWPAAPHLAAVNRFDAGVELGDLHLAAGNVALAGLRLDFYGPYVAPYFSEATHGEYLAFAEALAERLNAGYGALFAHCEAEAAPHLGSWFRGPLPGDALASVVYFTGALGHAPNFYSGSSDAPDSLTGIRKAIGSVDRAAAATEVSTFRALVAGRSGSAVSITFPFREGDLATRAALAIARNHQLRR
ncbi:MAG TPA: hypothetical protein VGM29_00855 [Polyangiaceae bacterium]